MKYLTNVSSQVQGILMDGSSNNRKFLKLHFDHIPNKINWNFIIKNPIKPEEEVIVMMDPSVSIIVYNYVTA